MLKTRIITAFFLGLFFSITLFKASDLIWALLTLSATLIAVWEWSNLIQLNKRQTWLNLACTASLASMILFSALLPAAYYIDVLAVVALCLATFFWLFIAPVWLLTRKEIHNRLLLATLCLLYTSDAADE